MYSLVVLLLCVALVNSFQFRTDTNVSLDIIERNGWEYRKVDTNYYNLGLILGANFQSASYSDDHKGTISAHVQTGAAYIAFGGFPFCFFSIFDGFAKFNYSSAEGFINTDMKASLAYLGMASMWLEESNGSNKPIITSLQWTPIGGMSYTSSYNVSGDLKTLTFSGISNAKPGLKVEFNHLIANVAGHLEDGTILTPKSVESFLEIKNYPYANQNNNLTIVFGIGLGGVKASKYAHVLRSEDGTMYASVSKEVTISGIKHSVTISEYTAGQISDTGNSEFSTQLTAKYGKKAAFRLVRVTFPAGASDIMYDPTIGTGSAVEDTAITGSASALVPASLLIALFLLLL